MVSKTFNRYIWLLNTLLQQQRLTFEEISYRWRDSYIGNGQPLALRTFHMHREAIAELFGVEIKCDTANGYEYYISSPDLLREDKTRQWLFNSFTLSNMITAGHNMKDRILFEDIPKGTEYLQTVIKAMQRGKVLQIDYQPFYKEQSFSCHILPYAMKVYNQRWYIVGLLKEQNGIRNIALDRIKTMVLTDENFKLPKDFDAESYYQNTVGIYKNENLEPQKVCIRAYGLQANYLRSLPLHHSQVEIPTGNKDFSEFEYYVCLTPELTSELLAMGDHIEVTAPQELRESIKMELQATLSRYNT